MTNLRSILFAAVALTLAACSSGFGGSAGGNMAPPVNPPAAGSLNAGATPTPTPSASPHAGSPEAATFQFAKASAGMQCPTSEGFSCTLYLNEGSPSPSPSPNAKGHSRSSATASPSPTPTPSPTPSPTPLPSGATPGPSGSPSPTPTPSGPHITLELQGLPKDAPAMQNPDVKAVATTPLIALRLHADDDVQLTGRASVDFTLPKEQMGGREFAIQLYHEIVGKKNKHSDTFFGTFSDSTVSGNTLHFEMPLPSTLTVKKDEIWLFVLYGNELPMTSASPSAHPSGSASPGVSASPSASPGASASPSPAPTGT